MKSVGFILMLFSLSVPASALELACPKKITTKQKIVNTPKPWVAGEQQYAPILSGVSLSDGPPAELAQLRADKGSSGKAFLVWMLHEPNQRNYWLECQYAHTTLTLSMPLPKGTKRCKVTYDLSVYVAGNPQVEKIWCE